MKSIKRELINEELLTVENEEKSKEAVEKKMSGPLKLSDYNYGPQEIDIKLSEELLNCLKNCRVCRGGT